MGGRVKYERIETGIARYNNVYRAAYRAESGKVKYKYFDLLEQARAYRALHRTRIKDNAKQVKRGGSKYTYLPVGITKTDRYVQANVFLNDKRRTKTAAYGRRRTYEEALKICLNWRLTQLKKMDLQDD